MYCEVKKRLSVTTQSANEYEISLLTYFPSPFVMHLISWGHFEHWRWFYKWLSNHNCNSLLIRPIRRVQFPGQVILYHYDYSKLRACQFSQFTPRV